MSPILIYIAKSAGSLAIFALSFYLFFKNDSFFNRNRFYLLGSLIASVLLPLLTIKIAIKSSLPTDGISTFAYAEPNTVQETVSPLQMLNWTLLSIYFTGAVFILVRSFMAYQKIRVLLKHSKKYEHRNMILSVTHRNIAPFSFLKWLVVQPSHINNPDFENIVQHESVHSRQYHSVDLILAELMLAMQWFNPFMWLLKKSIAENHEFIADSALLQKGVDYKKYQYSLVTFTTGVMQPAVVNYFNSNLLKKRIRMMNKNQSPAWHKVKNLTIGVSLALVASFAVSFQKEIVAAPFSESKTVVRPENKGYESTSIVPDAEKEISAVTSATSKAKNELVTPVPVNSAESPVSSENERSEQQMISSVEQIMNFFTSTILYPTEAAMSNVSGKVEIYFQVNANGKVDEVIAGKIAGQAKDLGNIVVVGYSKSPSEFKFQTDSGKLEVIGYADPIGKTAEKSEKYGLLLNEVTRVTQKLPLFDKSLSNSLYSISVTFKLQNNPIELKKEKLSDLKDKPLIILDGKEVPYEDLQKHDPNKIQSISVLKNDSAKALYGEKGAHGVIIITSK